MMSNTPPKPRNPLNVVRGRVNANDICIRPDAFQEAQDDFNWTGDEIKKCLLKLNDRYWFDDKIKNHFYKYEKHTNYPAENTHIDYYRAHKILDNESVYTHFYIRENTTRVIVNSFKELYKCIGI